jgi:hypothetical protein
MQVAHLDVKQGFFEGGKKKYMGCMQSLTTFKLRKI